MDTLIIYDEEEEYARNLMEYISEKKGVPFKVTAFSRLREIKRYAESKKISFLLISERSMNSIFSEMEVEHIIVLSEGCIVSENQEFPGIYKYQSSERILSEVLDYYAEIIKERGTPCVMNGRSTELIGVYSPVGRSGKTSFALTLGQIFAEEGPVLYINMEEFSGFREIFRKQYKGDLADLMYYYQQTTDAVGIKLQAVVSHLHGMDYIPPMVYSSDLRNVKSTCWKRLFCDIAATGMYNHIILDISSMVSDIFDILDICDTIYMPLINDRISMCKMNEWEQFLLQTEKEEIVNRTIKVIPPKLPNSEWSENYMEQLVWGEMGEFIRKMIKQEEAC